MHVHEHRPDRRRADLQIQRAFIVTLVCFWTTILLVFWAITPLWASGVWPLLELAETRGGRKAPHIVQDVFVSVTRTGEVYLHEEKATLAEITKACGEPRRNEIFIRVDRSAPFGAVREVLRAVQAADVERVTFLARPARSAGSER